MSKRMAVYNEIQEVALHVAAYGYRHVVDSGRLVTAVNRVLALPDDESVKVPRQRGGYAAGLVSENTD